MNKSKFRLDNVDAVSLICPRSGIALVAVLGFLSALTLLIASFAIIMRTERVAGSGYVDEAKARHLLCSALSGAMEEIRWSTTNQYFPDFSEDYETNALYSISVSAGSDVAYLIDDIDLTVRSAGTNGPNAEESHYVPGYYDINNKSDVYADYEAACASAEWVTITNFAGDEVIGRMAFVAVNCSGLIDINSVGSFNTPSQYASRREGLSPAELQLSSLVLQEDFNTRFDYDAYDTNANHVAINSSDDLSAALAVVYNRGQLWNRIESVRDTKKLFDVSTRLAGHSSGRSPAGGKYPYSFVPFSYYYQEMDLEDVSLSLDKDTFTNQLEKVATTMDTWGNEASADNLRDRFDELYDCYVDYTDPDSNPTNYVSPCVEKVPMINEIWIDNFFAEFDDDTPTGSTNPEPVIVFGMQGSLKVESWYLWGDHPIENGYEFVPARTVDNVVNSNEVGELFAEVWIGDGDESESNVVGVVLSLSLDESESDDEEDEDDYGEPLGSFFVEKFNFSYTGTNLFTSDIFTNTEPDKIVFKIESISSIYTNESIDADQVVNISIETSNFLSQVDGAITNYYDFGRECVDPRNNYEWDGDGFVLWEDYEEGSQESTANLTNSISSWGELAEGPSLADGLPIRIEPYVRNRPMENAAELGFLPTGEPWRTIRLCGGDDEHPVHPVLDYFYAGEAELQTSVRKGLININSGLSNLYATAFLNAPIENWPQDSSIDSVSVAQALLMGSNLASYVISPTNQSLAVAGNAITTNTLSSSIYTDDQRESVVANSYRLFGWRDNLFTVVVVAQPGKDVNGDGVLDSDDEEGLGPIHRAVALVWMDPKTKRSAVVSYIRTDSGKALSGYSDSWGNILQNFEP